MPAQTTRPVLYLENLLQELTPPCHELFLDFLLREGFEITRDIPNLQLPQEIDDSIGRLADARHADAWSRLHQTLALAAMDGTLVDLSYGAGGS